jgi:predicted transcriptional regulator
MLATMHRPTDPAGISAAARNLAATGLKPRDIASALSLTEHAVSQLLRESAASPLEFPWRIRSRAS